MKKAYSELLFAYADLGKQYPYSMATDAGSRLQHAYLAFLREASVNNSKSDDLVGDIAKITGRVLASIAMAEHSGEPCIICLSAFVQRIIDETNNEMKIALEAGADNNTSKRLN